MNKPLKTIHRRTQQKRTPAERASSDSLENVSLIVNRILVEICNKKGLSDEVSDGNEECVIGNYRKGDFYYKLLKNLAEFCQDLVFHGRRKQLQPTPVLLPEKSHGWRSLEGCSPWGR